MTINLQHFTHLIDQIKKESNSERRCLISGIDLTEMNTLQLPCGHEYSMGAFKRIFNKRKCPYCLTSYDTNTMVKNCTTCNKQTILHSSRCKSCLIPTCSALTKAGSPCKNKSKFNGKCSKHAS